MYFKEQLFRLFKTGHVSAKSETLLHLEGGDRDLWSKNFNNIETFIEHMCVRYCYKHFM